MIQDIVLGADDTVGPPRLFAQVVPTGGVIVIRFLACGPRGPWKFTRTAEGSAVETVLWQGPPIPFFVDCGDGTKVPLDSKGNYTYQLVTPDVTITLGPITPSGSLVVEPDGLTVILLRSLQAAFSNLTLEEGWVRPSVVHAMPLAGSPTLPIITFSMDTLRDSHVPLGQNVSGYDNEIVEPIYEIADRRYRVTALVLSVPEREFYRDAILGIFKVILGPLLAQLGQNVTHSYHAANNQVSTTKEAPGFYYVDASLQFSGTYAAHIFARSPGTFQSIGYTATPTP